MKHIYCGVVWLLFGNMLFGAVVSLIPVSSKFLQNSFPTFVGYIFLLYGVVKLKEQSSNSQMEKTLRTALSVDVCFWTLNFIMKLFGVWYATPDILQSTVDAIVGFLGLFAWVYYILILYRLPTLFQSPLSQKYVRWTVYAAKGLILSTILIVLGEFLCAYVSNTIGSIILILALILPFLCNPIYLLSLLLASKILLKER